MHLTCFLCFTWPCLCPVFEDSFHQLRSRTVEEMRLKLSVTFQVGCCFLCLLC